MGYLYGDATPFPLDENFIETLSALTDACVSLFRAETAMVKRQQQITSSRNAAGDELGQLQELGTVIQRSLTPFVQAGAASPIGTAASAIGQAAQEAIKKASTTISAKRDQAVHAATSVNAAEEVRLATAPFFIKHQLPDTSWGVEWKVPTGSERAELTVFGFAKENIRLTFKGSIPASSIWAAPLKVSELENELYITLSKEPGLLGKSTRKEGLHRLLVTGLRYTPGQFHLTLKSTTKKPVAGLQITIKDGSKPTPYVVQLGTDGKAEGKAEKLTGESAAAVKRLWTHVEKIIDALPAMRSSLTSIKQGARKTEECIRAQLLAETMLSIVAPIVVEMRKRSRVKGELGLKRELGDGRREEVFVPRDQLTQKFADLPDAQRRVFEAMGLSNEPTTEFLGSMLPGPDEGAMGLEEALSSAHEETKEVVIEAGDPDDEILA